jgi:hypothetical protein
MFDLTMTTPLILAEWGETIETTLALFFADNDLMDEKERELLMTALESEGEYIDGGGASAEWSLRIKNPQ